MDDAQRKHNRDLEKNNKIIEQEEKMQKVAAEKEQRRVEEKSAQSHKSIENYYANFLKMPQK